MKLFQIFASVLMLLGAAACETTGRSAVTLMSDYDYLRASPEERRADDEAVKGLIELEGRRERMLRAYLPVNYGDDRTGYTIQCVFQPGPFNAVATYPGHNPIGMDGANHEAMLVVQADKDCNIIYKQGPKNPDGSFGALAPNILLANATTRDDMLRELTTNAIPAILNGTGSALIAGATQCNENCGMSLMVQGGAAYAGANSASNSNTNVNVGQSGRCGPNPCLPSD